MNLFTIVTLNRHADFEEVLFTSVLSYFLNPEFDHGLGAALIERLFAEIYPEVKGLARAKVSSEYSLDKAGSVDIFIEHGKHIIALEAKIWDRSARNLSKDNVPQLERYCAHLEENFRDRQWTLVFLIPNELSTICLNEYRRADKKFPGRIRLLTWNFTMEERENGGFIGQSVSDMIRSVLDSKIKSLTPRARWLLESLYDIIPDLNAQIKDDSRFPSKADLARLPAWEIMFPFFEFFGRWPNPMCATVGFPYGKNSDKGTLHRNSLFRLRTAKRYYRDIKDKENNLPRDAIELELWYDVYDAVKDDIGKWMKKYAVKDPIRPGTHIDENDNQPVAILTLRNPLPDNAVAQLIAILRRGYEKA